MDLKEKFEVIRCEEQNSNITSYVANDLRKRKRMYLVNFHYSKKLERLYISAKKTSDSEFKIYLPIASKENLPYSVLNEYVNVLSENALEKSIVLAFYTQDAKCIYYRLKEGLPN